MTDKNRPNLDSQSVVTAAQIRLNAEIIEQLGELQRRVNELERRVGVTAK